MTETHKIAEQIRSARRERGWTQAELAQRAGVSTRSVQAAEAGTVKPQPGNLDSLRRVLELGADADDTREAWDGYIHVVLDIIGHMLSTYPPEERQAVVFELTDFLMERAARRGQTVSAATFTD